MKRPCWQVATLVLVMAAIAASAGGELKREIHLGGNDYGNFFQAADGASKEDVESLEAQLRLTWTPEERPAQRRFLRLGLSSYGGLDRSTMLRGGLAGGNRPRSWELFAETHLDRPTVDLDAGTDTSDQIRFAGRYAYRLSPDWEASGSLTLASQTFETLRDNDQVVFGGAVRYRGFGYTFSPEVGYSLGQRRAESVDQDYDQDEYWIKIRSAPMDRLYLSLRYRFRDRRYPAADPLLRNFGREDERSQWSLTATYDIWRSLAGTLYYAYLDADSTRPSRVFTTSVLSLGLSTRF